MSARSIFAFVDETLAAIPEQIERERDQLTRGTHAERLEVVNLILEGAPITAGRASARLAYELGRWHTAAVLWSDGGRGGPGRSSSAPPTRWPGPPARARPFTVVASASALWAWFAGRRRARPRAPCGPPPRGARGPRGARPGGAGMEGFRRGHLDALATQRLMHGMPGALRLAAYEDVRWSRWSAQDEDARGGVRGAARSGAGGRRGGAARDAARLRASRMSASRAARELFTPPQHGAQPRGPGPGPAAGRTARSRAGGGDGAGDRPLAGPSSLRRPDGLTR